MEDASASTRFRARLRAALGAAGVLTGEALVAAAHRPASDFYFPFVWIGLTLLLDGAVSVAGNQSLLERSPRQFLGLFAFSVAFWWLFELFNVAVQNWHYIGAGPYTGIRYVAFASLDFSTVLPAVWEVAYVVRLLLPSDSARGVRRGPPLWFLNGSVATGILCLVLPVVAPRQCFGLIWVSLFFLLDPLNARLGRPSIWHALWKRHLYLPLSFALGTLVCGFFWESWNEWAMPRWVYTIPYVGFWHVFQMPVLGYTGYLPFGLELFAMTNFALAATKQAPLTLPLGPEPADDSPPKAKTCAAVEAPHSRAV